VLARPPKRSGVWIGRELGFLHGALMICAACFGRLGAVTLDSAGALWLIVAGKTFIAADLVTGGFAVNAGAGFTALRR